MNHCTDDDQPEEWRYDGNSRPKACPLIEIKGDEEQKQQEKEIFKHIVVHTCGGCKWAEIPEGADHTTGELRCANGDSCHVGEVRYVNKKACEDFEYSLQGEEE